MHIYIEEKYFRKVVDDMDKEKQNTPENDSKGNPEIERRKMRKEGIADFFAIVAIMVVVAFVVFFGTELIIWAIKGYSKTDNEFTEQPETEIASEQESSMNETPKEDSCEDKETTTKKEDETKQDSFSDTRTLINGNVPKDIENPYNLPPSYFEEQALADKMIERYLSKEWDGYPIEEHGHTFSLSYWGQLLMDDYLTSPSEIHAQHCLDIPKDMKNIYYPMFILGEGTYLIEGWRITKYLRGEKIPLQGKGLDWSGMDTENYRPYDTYFYYDEPHDTLFIVASSVPYDYSDKEKVYNIGIYLYVMPDRTKSEIKFVDQIINLNIDEFGLYYLDTEGIVWRYVEKNGKLQFAKSADANLKNRFSQLGIAEGEIEFDWRCTFADGYPGERREFPEGTFTHPVTKTPTVTLTKVEVNYRYKNMYSS